MATRRPHRLSHGLQVAGAAVAAVGLAVLATISPAEPARAASGDSYNQITGQGATSSQITVPWTSGLLDSSNKPLTAANGEQSPNSDRNSASPTSQLKYMYDDFKKLKVTVSQTQNLHHQAITVTWNWPGAQFRSTGGVAQADFLQIMECYGDASTGPDPEHCEFGAPDIIKGANPPVATGIATRAGLTCPAGPAALGCDPLEPVANATPPHTCPATTCPDQTGVFTIPFVPVSNPGSPAYDVPGLRTWFNALDSNEVVQATTDSAGNGIQHFETVTGVESQGLGCGDDDSGHPRGCWLVVVPRGTWEPDDFQVDPSLPLYGSTLVSSPLSAGNWAQRIQVHLDYTSDGLFCSIDTPEIATVGTQTILRAMQSWELALNQQANCSFAYSYTQHTEGEVTTALRNVSNPAIGAGLGFTTIPVGTETTEGPSGGAPTKVPKMLYAPVAVTALDFGFNVNLSQASSGQAGVGQVTTPVKLTPQLLAKALTQTYRQDLPDYYPQATTKPDGSSVPPSPGPSWSQNNPPDITRDPEFQALNGQLIPKFASNSASLAPQLTGDNSAPLQGVWKWVASNPTASAWLNGTPDTANHIVVDQDYLKLKLGKPATPAKTENSFPRAYAGILNLGSLGLPPHQAKRTSLDMLPPQLSFDTAGANVLTSINPAEGGWDPSALDPTGDLGWWAKLPPQLVGQQFSWALVDTPSLAAYQLDPGAMCASDGTDGHGANCVNLTTDSVAAALKTAKPDSAGLLQVDPGKAQAAGAYPLVSVIYAAVPVAQPAPALTQYADLIEYAAGKGQTTGAAPGDLPPGYLPLTASLQQQARSVVAQLRALANPTPSHSPTTTPPNGNGGSSNGNGGSGNGGSGGQGTGQSGNGGGTTTPTTAPGASPSAPNPLVGTSTTPSPLIEPPTVQLVSGTTPKQPASSVRLVIVAVVIAGLASAGGGIVLRSGRMPRWRRRARGTP